MHTLVIRLTGPLQSWGVQSRFGMRDTGLEPSKSGVIGLLCAALGRPRSAPLDDLVSLQMGVRVDREGNLKRDFHTAQNVYKASGGIKETEISTRYYLADAAFLIGLQSADLALLEKLQAALQKPAWPLYLGRKSFVPGEPVFLLDGLQYDLELLKALQRFPWLGHLENRYDQLKAAFPRGLRVVLDDRQGDQVRPDLPLSFAMRRFTTRRVKTQWIDWPPFNHQYH